MEERLRIANYLIIVTAQCNSRCRYCYQTAKCDRSMEWGTLCSALELSLDAPSPVTLVFLGGEPLLEFSSIRRAVRYVQARKPPSKQVRYEISTNGLLLGDEIADFLKAENFSVQLSFDGVEKAQDLRAPGSFQALDSLLDRLRRNQPSLFDEKLRVCITLVPDAIPWLFDSVRYLAGKGVQRIGISPSLGYHPEWTPELFARLEGQFSAIFDHSTELFRSRGETPVLFLRKTAGDNEGRPVTEAMCALADGSRLAVDVDGQVYGCAMLAESYQELSGPLFRSALPPLRLGSVGDPDLMRRACEFPAQISQSDLLYYKLRKRSSYGKCSECEYAAACSVCPVSIGRDPNNTDPHRIPDFVCAFNRFALKYRSRFPAMKHPLGYFGELLVEARRQRLSEQERGSGHAEPFPGS